MADHDTRDSFIVRVLSGGQGAKLSSVRGSVEHVQSGEVARFVRTKQMLDFIEEHLGVEDMLAKPS